MSNLEGLVICRRCLEDKHLINQLPFKRNDIKQRCSTCRKLRVCVDYKFLAIILKNVIREHFSVASQAQIEWGIDNHSKEGYSLIEVVENLLGVISNIEDIVDYICTMNAYDVRNGDYRFFDNTDLYVKRKIYSDQFHRQWLDLVTELKTSRRFFSDKARHLFQKIFEDIENLVSYRNIKNNNGDGFITVKEPIVYHIPKGELIFRARKLDSYDSCRSILKKPKKELSPPPSDIAKQGRMNAKGVSIFYGAFDKDTCIAEMRSSIGSYLVVGKFETQRALKVLNFKNLESVVTHISYFQKDAKEQMIRWDFLHKLHNLISAPVVDGHEDEYLITQVLAEYLAYIREENFDGILFESTQLKGGMNIVIFPKNKSIEMIVPDFDFFGELADVDKNQQMLDSCGIEFIEGSEEIFITEKIKYESSPIARFMFDDFL